MTIKIPTLPTASLIEIEPELLTVQEPYKSIFTFNPERTQFIAADMQEKGYDKTKPIICRRIKKSGKCQLVVIMGHHRREAAIQAGIKAWIVIKEYESESEAINEALYEQGSSRKFADNEIFQCILTLSSKVNYVKNKKVGSIDQSDAGVLNRGELKALIARQLRVGEKKIQNAFAVIDKGDASISSNILNGKITIHKAYQQINSHKNKKCNGLYRVEIDKDTLCLFLKEKRYRILTFNPQIQYSVKLGKAFPELKKKVLQMTEDLFRKL